MMTVKQREKISKDKNETESQTKGRVELRVRGREVERDELR